MPPPEKVKLTSADIRDMDATRFAELREHNRQHDLWYFPTPEYLADGSEVLVEVEVETSPVPFNELEIPADTTAIKIFKTADGRTVYIRSYEEDGAPHEDIYMIDPDDNEVWGITRFEPGYARENGLGLGGLFEQGKMVPIGKDNGYVTTMVERLTLFLGNESNGGDGEIR